MKKAVLLTVSILLLFALIAGLYQWNLLEAPAPAPQSVDVPHMYPDTTTREFQAYNHTGKLALLQVSEEEVKSLTTRALIITIITYPLFSKHGEILSFLKGRCNLNELISRPGWENALEAQRLIYLEEGQTEYVERIEALQRSWEQGYSSKVQ